MNKRISPVLEGSSSWNLFYELNNGNVIQVYADIPETEAEAAEMKKYDPEHAKNIDEGTVYHVREYDPEAIILKYSEDPYWFDEGEAEELSIVHDYGTFYGNNAEENGLFDAIEARGLDITERYTPYTTRVVDFVNPKEAYEQGLEVKSVEITGFDEFDMGSLTGIIALENGNTYDFTYNPEKDLFCYSDSECGDIVVKRRGEIIGRDQMEDNMIHAFEDFYKDGSDIQVYPDFYNAKIWNEKNGDEEWIYGCFNVEKQGRGVDSRIDFYCPMGDPDRLEIDRQGGLAPRNVPKHLLAATWEKADDMVHEFLEKKNTREKPRNMGR